MKSTTIALDLASTTIEVAVSNHPGRVRERHRLSRKRVLPFFRKQEPAKVLMEACGSAHYWARAIRELGHEVQLLPPHAVRPYVTRNKTDRADAKGILEAFRNEEILPVPIKSPDQQALAAIHRLRSAWITTRTARLNALRGCLREFGILIPLGARKVAPHVRLALEDAETPIPDLLRPLLAHTLAELEEIEQRIHLAERALVSVEKTHPDVERSRSIPGVGPMISTAIAAFVGDLRRFPSARRFSSYLGITPKENSTGKTRRLGAISRRGDPYLRSLLIQGAHSMLWRAHLKKDPDRVLRWALEVQRRRGTNKAAVALANKMARMIWAVCTHETPYRKEATAS